MTGKELKKYLILHDLEQEDAAKIVGVTRQTINSWCQKDILGEKILLQVKLLFDKYGAPFTSISSNSGSVILSGNNSTGNIDNPQYYSDSPDVLRAQIDELERLMADKEERIKEKDAQIKEKDAQIHRLLSIVEASVPIKKEEK